MCLLEILYSKPLSLTPSKENSDISFNIRNLYPKIMPKFLNLIILKEHKNMFLPKL